MPAWIRSPGWMKTCAIAPRRSNPWTVAGVENPSVSDDPAAHRIRVAATAFRRIGHVEDSSRSARVLRRDIDNLADDLRAVRRQRERRRPRPDQRFAVRTLDPQLRPPRHAQEQLGIVDFGRNAVRVETADDIFGGRFFVAAPRFTHQRRESFEERAGFCETDPRSARHAPAPRLGMTRRRSPLPSMYLRVSASAQVTFEEIDQLRVGVNPVLGEPEPVRFFGIRVELDRVATLFELLDRSFRTA